MIFDHLYTFFVHKSAATKYSFTLLAVAICFGFWFFLIYSKLSNTQNILLIDIQGLEKKENLRTNLSAESSKISLEINELKNKIKKSFKNECEVDCVIRLAKSCNLKVASYVEEQCKAEKTENSNLVNFSIQGRFEQIYNFLEKLNILVLPVEPNNLTLSLVKEDVIQMNVVYNFYRNFLNHENQNF